MSSSITISKSLAELLYRNLDGGHRSLSTAEYMVAHRELRNLLAKSETDSEPLLLELNPAYHLLKELLDKTCAFHSALECDHDFDGENWANRAKALIDWKEV